MRWLLTAALAASVIGALLTLGCSGTSETHLPNEPRDAASDPSPTTSRGDASSQHDVGTDRSQVDAATTSRPDVAAIVDVNALETRAEVAAIDGSRPFTDSAVDARVEAGTDGNTSDASRHDGTVLVFPESSTPANDAHLADGSSRACGVPNDCIVSAPVPTQTSQLLGMTMTLCPAGANAPSGVCIVEANLGDASWSASADAGPNVLEGSVGLRGRDIVLVVSTLLGPATCHFAVGGSAFVPVPWRIRLLTTPTSATVVGCSALSVGEIAVIGAIPTTVTGPALCSDVVLPQLRPMVVDVVEAGLRQAIQQQVCLR